MDFTNLDAIEFSHDKRAHIRLYYQTKDKVIRESSFETDNGWFVRTNGVIATNAKENTPITATRWEKNNEIRVYFLDKSGAICEAVGTHTSAGTVWLSTTPSNVPVSNTPNQTANAALWSSLAIARPGIDEETLRLFYQVESAGKFPICEIRYQDDVGTWTLQRRKIERATKGSSFSAASAGKTGKVRVYYVDSRNILKVGVWNSPFSKWEEFEVGDNDFILSPKAPISAVCWYDKPREFRVCIYTILSSKPTQIFELARNGDNWKKELSLVDLGAGFANTSAVALSRNKGADVYNPISVFYQPDRNTIEMVIADREGKVGRATALSLSPHGVPTARGPLQNITLGGQSTNAYQQVPDGFEVVESSKVIQPGQKAVPESAVVLGPDETAIPSNYGNKLFDSTNSHIAYGLPGYKVYNPSTEALTPADSVCMSRADFDSIKENFSALRANIFGSMTSKNGYDIVWMAWQFGKGNELEDLLKKY